ncbi:DUF3472 domain-containing protein [Symbioplanes lichenis]|uniref:DUF3472 domain-containing protein n=1 Tax=Symbioplanes lichenis TaxID=1629072 RepID=UPI002738A0D0|nr:DUF3472 domain-containing protein [Actinoplanes lichenis]
MKRLLARTVLVLTVLAGGLAGVASPAAAAPQHQNANMYAFWNFRGASGFWNVDQQVRVSRKAHHTYWALNFDFAATPGEGGYTGLQTDGLRFDRSSGDTAIFSLWNANGIRGRGCGSFGGEGSGLSCRIAYPIRTDRFYRYRVWRLETDSRGQWWGAWVQDTRTGRDTLIGQIRVARSKRLTGVPMNFSEYWGPARSCDGVPVSTAYFTQPAANSRGGGRYEYGSTFARSTRSTCTGGSTSLVRVGTTRAAKVTMGGRR